MQFDDLGARRRDANPGIVQMEFSGQRQRNGFGFRLGRGRGGLRQIARARRSGRWRGAGGFFVFGGRRLALAQGGFDIEAPVRSGGQIGLEALDAGHAKIGASAHEQAPQRGVERKTLEHKNAVAGRVKHLNPFQSLSAEPGKPKIAHINRSIDASIDRRQNTPARHCARCDGRGGKCQEQRQRGQADQHDEQNHDPARALALRRSACWLKRQALSRRFRRASRVR
ncbi:MAG: hypothetical protein BWZ10_00508 [candidate division BRC1 bacterium ADurb.BinA364]|nr:MAG: hypothetical protein BWZ10_00508 [candidate division BRC1 bacterium ADurb.BinA364]